jgi:hypothetical protein
MLGTPASRRRVVISLAALVDLLFVVMFLQFVELQRVGDGMEKAKAAAEQSKLEADELKESALADQDKLVNERNALHDQVQELLKKIEEYEKQLRKAGDDREGLLRQTAEKEKALGEAVGEMLQGIDSATVAAQLRGADEDQVKRMIAELRDAQGKNPGQIIQSLRKASELKKRCDIWETHLYADGSVRIKGPDVQETLSPTGKDSFATDFLKLTKKAPEPKSLVIILLTYENCTVGALTLVEEGLESVRRVWTSQLSAGKSIQVSQPNYTESAP